MKVLIYGAGAIGSVFAGFLSKENDVTIIARQPHVVSGIWGEHTFSGLSALDSVEKIPRGELYDLIMITTKAYDTRKAAGDVLGFIASGGAAMSMQNGIGNEAVIANAVGVDRTMGGMAIFGARLTGPGEVEVTVYASECIVGDLKGSSERAEKVAAAFTKAGIPTKTSDNVIRDKWMKAFYNIETRELIKAMLKEAFNVAERSGVSLDKTWEEYYTYLLEHQIDYLNGAIVKMGSENGISTPVNKVVTDIIKALEKSKA